MHDRQAVVQARVDSTIKLGSTNIAAKPSSLGIETKIVDFPILGEPEYHAKLGPLSEAVKPPTLNSRLYIRGHGSWQNQTVGGVDAKTWARTLLNAGMYKVGIISICACNAGRDKGGSDNARLTLSAGSFASQFHKWLDEMANLKLVVYARTYFVVVDNGFWSGIGQKRTKAVGKSGVAGDPVHGRKHSKLRFSWEGSKQKREWVDYDTGGTESIEEDLGIGSVNAT